MRATNEQYREAAFAKLEGVEHVEVEPNAWVLGHEEHGRWVTALIWVTHDEAAKVKP